jgi:hypothetical protein
VRSGSTGPGGIYRFPQVRPGNYTLEVDPATLPANFRFPAQSSREIRVEPLQEYYLYIPVSAERAIAGIIFIDNDGDRQFNPRKDQTVEGAYVTANGRAAVSGVNGAYILRNLAAGKVQLHVRSPQGAESSSIVIELGAEPITKREVNIMMPR